MGRSREGRRGVPGVAGVALAAQRLSMRISSKLIDRAEVWTQTPTQEPTLQGTGSFPPPLMMTQAQIESRPPSTSPRFRVPIMAPPLSATNHRSHPISPPGLSNIVSILKQRELNLNK